MAAPFIKLENVELYYDKGEPAEVHALKDINLEIDEGEYAAFFGPSGCGKSSLLYIIAGVESMDGGKTTVKGHDFSTMTSLDMAHLRQNELGMVFQMFNLVPTLTVLDNVMLPMVFIGADPEQRRLRALDLLKRFGLEELGKRFPGELSGGQQQRVGIARSLANDPSLVLADEPLGNLDSKNAVAALDLLRELHEKDNRTIIIVTHEAWSLRDAEKIFYMKDGAIVNVEKRERKPKGKVEEMKTAEVYKSLYPELTKETIMVKTLAEAILRGYPMEETKRFEFFLLHLIQGKITIDEFKRMLDLPFREGGVGLWKSTAENIAERIGTLLEEWKHVSQLAEKMEKNPDLPFTADIQKIRSILVKNYLGILSQIQLDQLDEIIGSRLRKIISKDDFKKILILSAKNGGLGFFRNTGERMAEQMEIFLENKMSV